MQQETFKFSTVLLYLEISEHSLWEYTFNTGNTLNPLLHRDSFDAFTNRADPDQAALTRAAWSQSSLFANGNMIRYDPTLVDLTSNFLILCTNTKIYVYSKTCVKQPRTIKLKIDFQDELSLNAGQKYCRMLQGEHSAILSAFIKLLYLSLRSLFCLFLCGCFTQLLLYTYS